MYNTLVKHLNHIADAPAQNHNGWLSNGFHSTQFLQTHFAIERTNRIGLAGGTCVGDMCAWHLDGLGEYLQYLSA